MKVEFENNDEGHNHGLAHDWPKLVGRRSFIAGGSALLLGVPSLAQTLCVADPRETQGPFPADGSNGRRGGGGILDVLTEKGVVRSDIRSSFGALSGQADGTPLVLDIECVDVNQACAPIPNLSIYVWHCDADGRYSLYELPEQNYLRGVNTGDANGKLQFTTIFPGCYRGRWPHIHFEVFRDLGSDATVKDSLLVSQFAFDRANCEAVYQSAPYQASVRNLSRLDIARDMVFEDNSPEEIAMQTIAISNDSNGLRGTVRIGLAL